MISFTGSTDTAKKIISDSSKGNLKKLSLELGGKNPIIVNDLFKIKNIRSIVDIIMENGGQACIGEVCYMLIQKYMKNSRNIFLVNWI